MKHYVYILQSTLYGTFYTGLSSEPERRLYEHNHGYVKATKSKRPWKIVHIEPFNERCHARKREKFLKSGAGREERGIILQSKSTLAR